MGSCTPNTPLSNWRSTPKELLSLSAKRKTRRKSPPFNSSKPRLEPFSNTAPTTRRRNMARRWRVTGLDKNFLVMWQTETVAPTLQIAAEYAVITCGKSEYVYVEEIG